LIDIGELIGRRREKKKLLLKKKRKKRSKRKKKPPRKQLKRKKSVLNVKNVPILGLQLGWQHLPIWQHC